MKSRSLLLPVCALLAAGALLLGGCTSPALTSSMVAAPMAVAAQHPEALSIHVTGGADKAGMAQISNADFAEAIRQSVKQSGLFAQAVLADPADYHLDVNIVRLEQPMMGFSMTVTLEATWTLTRASDKAVLWQKSVVSTHTTGAGESFQGVTRVRLATEGAAKKNIENALGQLGKATW